LNVPNLSFAFFQLNIINKKFVRASDLESPIHNWMNQEVKDSLKGNERPVAVENADLSFEINSLRAVPASSACLPLIPT
jgi:hypothetical protein